MNETILIYLDSLGCAKNLVDSEAALGLFAQRQYLVTGDPAAADVIMVNTCGFINDAKEESIDRILELAELKNTGNCKVLVVTGCLVQKYKAELQKEIPEVDIWLGTTEYQRLIEEIEKRLPVEATGREEASLYTESGCLNRVLLTPPYYAYLKIAEGCNNCCSFCAIPSMRGKLASRPMEHLVAEAKGLVKNGIKELILIAQDTTAYGLDIYGKPMLPTLLAQIAELDIPWIRVLYCYPNRIDQALLEVMAKYPNVCRYMDIPIQHVSKPVLQKMGRNYGRKEIEALFAKIKQYMPNIAIRTTLMVGFPGETEEDFAELLSFARQQELAWAGVFMYSPEEGTRAFDMARQVPEEIKRRRYNQLTAALALASGGQKQGWVGQTMEVLVEGPAEDLPGYYTARSQYQAPGVDGLIYIENQKQELTEQEIGVFAKVTIHTAEAYDLIGALASAEK